MKVVNIYMKAQW